MESVAKASGEFLEIVNYNLAGQQYAIAGTIAGLKALKADSARRVAAFGGKPAFMLVPGIDVPFHSTLLRKGVPEFRDKLDALLPAYIDYRGRLVDRYIPNLVATPFEMTKEFAAKILEVVPSERIKAALDDPAVWDSYADDDQKLGRLLLTELLSWQFASRCVGLKPRRCSSVSANRAAWRGRSSKSASATPRPWPTSVPRPCICPSSPATIRSSTTSAAMKAASAHDRHRFAGSRRWAARG